MLGPPIFGFQIFVPRNLDGVTTEQVTILMDLFNTQEYEETFDDATRQHIITLSFKSFKIASGKKLYQLLKEKGFNVWTFVVLS